MSLFNHNSNYQVNHGTDEYGAQLNVGELASVRALSKSSLTNGFNLIKCHGGTTDCSSALSTMRSMSISERTAADEQSLHGAGPFNPARSMYAPQMQQTHTQPLEMHSQSFGVDQRYQMPYYHCQPVQILVPSHCYLNMLPIQSPVSSVYISQSPYSGTSQVYTSQHTIIDPSTNSLVTDGSKHSSNLISSNASASRENLVTSSNPTSYYSNIKPVLSPAFSVAAVEVPPIMQSCGKEIQVNPRRDHISCSISTEQKSLTHGVANAKSAHELNIPARTLTQLKPTS